MVRGCICGKARERLMFAFEGTCLWCGHGHCCDPTHSPNSGRPRRLPRDLGRLQRIGGRVPLHFENVVHLDRIRNLAQMREIA